MKASIIDPISRAQWTTLVTGRYMITMMMLLCYVNLSGGQRCTDSVNIQQAGFYIDRNRLAIIPRLNFTCDGRITGIRARVFMDDARATRNDYPFFQVWRPTSDNSTIYNKIGEVQLQLDDQVTRGRNGLQEANITLTGNNTIEFQSGDVVGYYHPPNARYLVIHTNRTIGYVLYHFNGSPGRNSVNLRSKSIRLVRQPLLQFTIDIQCHNLSSPANGIMFCNSGRVGVGYEGDTCSFTCNTGYELTGNDTRICQRNATWSGIEVTCSRDSRISDGGSGSSGAAIGGTVGGILFIIMVIIIVLVVIFYIRQLHRRKTQESSKNVAARDYQNTITIDNEAYEQSIAVTSSPKPVYEEPSSTYHSILNAVLSTINGAQEPRYESSIDWYGVSSPLPQELIEKEEEICNTPYEDEGNYGPVYCEPPSDEQKIYAEFEGKRFRKLYHREIQSFEELGTGEFGVVTHCKWKPSTNKAVEVAVKTLNSNASDKNRLRFLQEAAIMCQFDHQNVIKLHGVVTEAPIMIVLEYMKHGDLKNVLMQLRPVKGITAHAKLPLILLKFCSEIAAGMTYLSGKQFVHRDLAARNILVSNEIVCKIADFGMSRDLIDGNYYVTSGGKIPVKWTAPEALHYRKYSVQSDVWSYGCVLYEIWSLGYKPFEELTNIETLKKVDDDFRLPPPPGCPRTIYRVMMKCWHPDPRSRPQFGQITKLLTGNSGYLLGWSDEDKQIGGEDAMKLGAPLKSAHNLYYDLQLQYKQIKK